ncbi:hypothetical protein AWR31_08890 [Campylobacter fetus subsp. venerealis]|nr:hypothetical protein CFVI03596_08755 [Campylobacter fetus subsp. venerealis cfvi03/596]OCS23152.1 hypothetical protein CFVI9825_09375 [Campylobacter fetus subsp. venerealis cfvi9825]OCS32706.1 hypothetical protein AWR31_08890 [Campylobacter fetus subsp. venerealis]
MNNEKKLELRNKFELFFWLLSWVCGWISLFKESIMELINLSIAVIAVLVTLFREEIRKFLFKPK